MYIIFLVFPTVLPPFPHSPPPVAASLSVAYAPCSESAANADSPSLHLARPLLHGTNYRKTMGKTMGIMVYMVLPWFWCRFCLQLHWPILGKHNPRLYDQATEPSL